MRNAATQNRWRQLVAEHARSGLSIVEYCRRKGISQASFFQWRKKLQALETPGRFVPVSLVHTATSGATVEVAFPCGAILRLPASEEAALRWVVAALLAVEGSPR